MTEQDKPEFVPEVVDETGKKVVRPDVVQMVAQLSNLAQLARIRRSLEKEHFEGKLGEKTLICSGTIGVVNLLKVDPYREWAKVSFYNRGPDTAQVSINNAFDWQSVIPDSTLEADLLKAEVRIKLIYYKADQGKTATVTAMGKY